MTLPAIEIETGPSPTAAMIVLHGLGADGNDFVPVCEELDPGPVGPIRYVLPHAPVRPVTINGGMPMRAWYDLLGLDLARVEDEAGLRASAREVEALIDRERERGIPPQRIVLAGFSQGCAMTLMAGLRYRDRLAGLVGMSGYLPLAAKTAAERSASNADVPILLAHGSLDGVVPLASATASRDWLRSHGWAPEWHEYTMAHSVCLEEIAAVQDFMRRVLA